MKEVYRLFLDTVKASLEKISVNWQDDISPEEWTLLFSLFDLHGILPMGYNAVYGCPAAKTAETVLLPYKRRAMQSVMIQTVKTDEFLKLINSLKGEGDSSYEEKDTRHGSDCDNFTVMLEWVLRKTSISAD